MQLERGGPLDGEPQLLKEQKTLRRFLPEELAPSGEASMCDYSLHTVASRPARVGDKIVTSRFSGTHSRGFAPIAEPNIAVCVLPGTEIAFEKPVKHQGFIFPKKTNQTTALFRQINTEFAATHHDALEFADGTIVLLNRLSPGQKATILQLPVGSWLNPLVNEQTRSPAFQTV